MQVYVLMRYLEGKPGQTQNPGAQAARNPGKQAGTHR